jgi:hypothetical protein
VWGLDLVGPLQKAPGGYTHLLVATDKFSKWIEVRPLNSIRSEQAVAFFSNTLQGPPPTARGLGPTRHASWPRAEEAKPPRVVHATAERLRAFLRFRPDQRAKGRAAMRAACNRAKWARPSHFQRTLDCGTSTATRGNPAYDPAVPARRDGQYGQKWAGSNSGGRRAGAAVTSSAKPTPHPGAVR